MTVPLRRMRGYAYKPSHLGGAAAVEDFGDESRQRGGCAER
jgi:hypothetical protein